MPAFSKIVLNYSLISLQDYLCVLASFIFFLKYIGDKLNKVEIFFFFDFLLVCKK